MLYGSSSRCCGLVCIVLLWYFLIILTFFFINPFSYQEKDIINLVTKAVTPDKIKQDICRIEEVGVANMSTYLQARIKTEQENIWANMQKVKH